MRELDQVRIKCGEAERAGTISAVSYSSQERLRRVLILGLYCLGALICGALIPGAHFILVPAILIGSPVMLYKRWILEREIVEADILCAACGGELTRLATRMSYPIYESCLSCRRENRIEVAAHQK